MNAPPFPLNPSIGQWFQNWVWNGSRWVCSRASGVRVLTTVFKASGPYQPSPGLVTAIADCIGGGGGSGGVGPITSAQIMGGAGGGSGGRSIVTLPAALVVGGVNVTIGVGGAAGADNGGNGGNGGSTSFGAFCLANGGLGGGGVNGTSTYGGSGAGAPAGTGDVAFPGAGGFPGTLVDTGTTAMAAEGGMGGSIVGGNVNNRAFPGTGATGFNAADNTGAGASGGVVNQWTGAHGPGGAGGSGICIVTEYCWADAADSGEDCLDPGTVNINARVTMAQDEGRPPKPWPPGPGPWPKPPVIPFGEGEWDDGQS